MPLCDECRGEAEVQQEGPESIVSRAKTLFAHEPGEECSRCNVAETSDEDPRPTADGLSIPSSVRHATDAPAEGGIDATVWRLRWEMNGLVHYTAWSIHYDLVRELREDYRTNWPGCDVEMQAASVTDVSEPRTMDFGGA